jgi:4-hydroxybenzoate polyprenyltransferase
VAGAALAVANALADLERDRAAGTETVATSLGAAGARRIGAALMLIAVAAAVASAVALGGPSGWVAVVGAGGILALGGVLVGWAGSPRARQRAWELQGLAAGIMATGWIGAVAAGGALA